MLDFVLFAATFAVALIILVIYLYPARARATTIPGLTQTDPQEGNFPDIQSAGSIAEFLIKLHEDFGEIASFWMGSEMVVSLASPEYYEQHQHVYDRPEELYELYKPLLGTNSIMFSCGQLARKRHKLLCKSFNCTAESDSTTSHIMSLCGEIINKWSAMSSQEHVPLWQYMKAFSLKCSAKILFGDSAFEDDKKIVEFSRLLDTCFLEMEHQLTEVSTEEAKSRNGRFNAAMDEIMKKLRSIVEDHQSSKRKSSSEFLSSLIDSDLTDDMIIDDLMTCLFYYYSMSSVLAWSLYFISTHSEVQDKLNAELIKGKDQCKAYLSKVIKETLRIAPVFTWTARKLADIDSVIGGHVIPKNTAVIHAVCVSMMSDKYWSMPKLFNPDRFDADDNSSKFAFIPFGFSGGRTCPAETFLLMKLNIFLYEICSRFILSPVDDQVIVPMYGVITKPAEEIWITLKKHDK